MIVIRCICGANTIAQGAAESTADFKKRASDEGWRVGKFKDTGGYNAAPSCVGFLTDPQRLDGVPIV